MEKDTLELNKEINQPLEPKMRQFILETDGINIKIVKSEVTNLELQAIATNILNWLSKR